MVMARKNVKLTSEYHRGEAQHIKKHTDLLTKDINKDGHPKREAIKKRIIEAQHRFFKTCQEKDLHKK